MKLKSLQKLLSLLLALLLNFSSFQLLYAGVDLTSDKEKLFNAISDLPLSERHEIINKLTSGSPDYAMKVIGKLDTATGINLAAEDIKNNYLENSEITKSTISNALNVLVRCSNDSAVYFYVKDVFAFMDKPLDLITAPNNIGGIMDKINTTFGNNANSYKYFINGLKLLKDEINEDPIEYSSTGNIETSIVLKTYNDILKNVISGKDNPNNAYERIDAYYDKLLDLIDKVNAWPNANEKAYFIIDLHDNQKVLTYQSGAPTIDKSTPVSHIGTPVSGGGGGSGISDTTTQAIDELTKELNNISGSSLNDSTIIALTDSINAAAEAISELSDANQALLKAKELIASSYNLVSALNSSNQHQDEVMNAILGVAESVLKKISTKNVTTELKDSVATADMSQTSFTTMINDVHSDAIHMENTLLGCGVTKNIEAVLNINVAADPSAKEINVKLPETILQADNKKVIDKVKIETGIATLSIEPGAVVSDGTGTLSLSVQKLDNAKFGGSPAFEFKGDIGGKSLTFTPPIEVAVPYDLKADENPNSITVYLVKTNADGTTSQVNVAGTYDEATKTVKFTTPHFSTYVVKENKVSFDDVTGASWYKQSVESMASKGIISGVGEGKFLPDGFVTRAQFAAMMVRAFKLTDEKASCSFSDVKSDAWYYKEIASAVKAGLISGRTDGTFAPNDSISRQDMAVIINRALIKIKNKATIADASKYLKNYKDSDKIFDYAKSSIAGVISNEIMGGVASDSFAPQDISTRAQASAVVYRLINLK